MTRQKKRPGGSVLIWNFAERGCARSVSRRTFKMLRLVSDTAALRSNQDTTGQAGASLAPMALRWILEFPAVTWRDSRRETSGAGRLAVLNHHRNPNRQMKEITIKIRIKNFRSPIMMHQRTDLTVVKRANFLHLIGG